MSPVWAAFRVSEEDNTMVYGSERREKSLSLSQQIFRSQSYGMLNHASVLSTSSHIFASDVYEEQVVNLF